MPKTPIKIVEGNFRWKIAQLFLRILYRRKSHYISPWKGISLASIGIFHRNGKVLMSLRSGDIEFSGTWGLVGGFVNISDHEDLSDSLVREVLEETGLKLNKKDFPQSAIKDFYLWHGKDMIEMANYSGLLTAFYKEMTDEQAKALQPKDETEAFDWIDAKTFEKMVANKEIIAKDTIYILRRFFERQK